MCLILFSYKHHPKYRLVLAANRDEYYDRPAAPMQFWKDHPDVLAGRDLKSMGTWMGITRSGRLAAITNYRDPATTIPKAPSRGHLISQFLIGEASPAKYLEAVKKDARKYNGFNLLVGDTRDLAYYSNRQNKVIHLESNTFGLSNRLLDTQWPKVKTGKQHLTRLLRQHNEILPEPLLDLLQNQAIAPDHQLPDTGIGTAWERTLSPIFISSPNYGTRCSTILTIDRSNHVRISEHTWQQGKSRPVLQQARVFEFVIGPNTPHSYRKMG
jgi:uncharacterized protein with NRDE domain